MIKLMIHKTQTVNDIPIALGDDRSEYVFALKIFVYIRQFPKFRLNSS